MLKRVLALLFIICGASVTLAQNSGPKLVVGIVVDQMRYDFLTRYASKYGEGGFKRLLREGYSCENTHYSYVPTATAPGHAAIYTGVSPSVNGIVGNDWYDRTLKKSVYCTTDTSVQLVGKGSKWSGRMSPRNMKETTFSDLLKNVTDSKSKAIGIALKDRGAILPVGHKADAAYWYDGSGNWISSTYYFKELPQWVDLFNEKKLAANYLSKPWNTLLPIDQYGESTSDDVPYEGKFDKEARPVFPHDLPVIRSNNFDLIRSTPFGNSLTKDFAIEALVAEKLGKGNYTDVITISFSSTDYVGHQFGPHSIEVEDTYLRLDKDLEELLNFLDMQVGKNQYLLFLTGDHGVAYNHLYMKDHGVSTGLFKSGDMKARVNKMLNDTYGEAKWILSVLNEQIYLNQEVCAEKKLDLSEVRAKVATVLLSVEGVAKATTVEDIKRMEFTEFPEKHIKNGFYESRCGDVFFTLKEGWMEHKETGTTHGSGYAYDTHVPLIWFGWNISHGATTEIVDITDIAPTVTYLTDRKGTIERMVLMHKTGQKTGKPIPALIPELRK